MEPSVRDTLRQLIVRYGHALCDDPRRCEAMLRDLCGQHKREVFILVSALRQRVAADLLGGGGGLPTPLLLGRLRKRLEDELGLSGEAAHWAVETWALALGVIAGPVIVPAPTPTPAAALQPPPKPAKETRPPPKQIAIYPAHSSAPPKSAKESQPPPLPTFRDRFKDGGEGPEMVRLPPGRFLMGAPAGDDLANASERPQHEVRIARPFAIGRFPVTFEDYDRFVRATWQSMAKRGFWALHFGGAGNKQPELPDDNGWGRGRRPVINVTWHDAVAYCVWLAGQTGRTYRLPTEAEWEYAGRAGTATRWSCGDDAQALSDHAWFGANSGGRPHPVGEKLPNPGGSTTSTGMSGSGYRTAGTSTIRVPRPMARRGAHPAIPLAGCCAAVPGTAARGARACCPAPGVAPTLAALISVCGLPRIFDLYDSYPFLFLSCPSSAWARGP
jgi:formylglycine-generating enzyme required for sulfatase activity|nr:formylglycine-generating enzyme family protein [uncultured Thiodictyon sp.]